MIYSNDDTDKEIRKRNYLLTVFLIPIVTAIAIVCITYVAYSKHFISEIDRNYGYGIAVSIPAILFAVNRRKWLKIPDGSYFKIQEDANQSRMSVGEPLEYDKVYVYSKINKAISVFAGLITVALGVFIFHAAPSILIPILTIAGGLFILYQGVQGLMDRTPKLKLSKKGLWTNKLGFVNWANISKAEVVIEKSGEHSSTVLEICLKDSVFAEAKVPDEKLLLDDIADKRDVERNIKLLSNKKDDLTS